jgi:hypothetical protein
MVPLRKADEGSVSDEDFLTDTPGFKLFARNEVIDGPHGDGEHSGSFFAVI